MPIVQESLKRSDSHVAAPFGTLRLNRPRRHSPDSRERMLLVDPLIFFVALLASRAFSCRHGLADGLCDFFVV